MPEFDKIPYDPVSEPLLNAGAPVPAASESLPGVVAPTGARRANRRWLRPRILVPGAVVLLMCVIGLFPQLFSGWFGHGDPLDCRLIKSGAAPEPGHPFGFDVQGCDLYANVIHGAGPSIAIGLLTTLITVAVGATLGALAGFYRGWVDQLISRVMDVFFGFPSLVGMIVLLSVWRQHDIVSISALLALFMWPQLARVMRASVLETMPLDYIAAARGVGATTPRLLVRHVGLNSITPVLVLAGLNVGAIITAEAALTFLGVGLQSPTISWGVQLNTAQRYFIMSPHLLVFPSIFLTLTVLAFVLLGDAVRDTLDPKLAR